MGYCFSVICPSVLTGRPVFREPDHHCMIRATTTWGSLTGIIERVTFHNPDNVFALLKVG